jgi:hypothetical protein
MGIAKEAGEWLDKEPRADGKPRRWRPFVARTSRQFIPQECRDRHPAGNIQPRGDTQGTQLSEARNL